MTRINRRVVIGGVALGVTAIAGLVILAVRPIVWTAQDQKELLNTENKSYAEGLDGLPKRYDAVRLSPERLGEIAPAGEIGITRLKARPQDRRCSIRSSKISFASRVRRGRRPSFSRSRARHQCGENRRHQVRRPILRAMR